MENIRKSKHNISAIIMLIIMVVIGVMLIIIRRANYGLYYYLWQDDYSHIRVLNYGYIRDLLFLVICIAITVLVFLRKNNIILLSCIGALSLIDVINCVKYYKWFSSDHYFAMFWQRNLFWAYDWSFYDGSEVFLNSKYIHIYLIRILAFVSLFLISLFLLLGFSKKVKDKISKWCFIPALLSGINVIFACVNVFYIRNSNCQLYVNVSIGSLDEDVLKYVIFIIQFMFLIFETLSMYYLCNWIASPYKSQSEKKREIVIKSKDGFCTVNPDEAYCSMGKHVILLLVTFGIWLYIWIYRTTKYLNQVEGEQYKNPTTKLLLNMFVPFYSIYWIYTSSKRLDQLSKSRGVESDMATTCLILAIFVPIVPLIIMQERINTISTRKDVPEKKHEENISKDINLSKDVPELLKQYKELLDSGIITEEEYNEKKKQLLDL